ncbi:unnamed protein product [Victoria cruziana]
MLALANCFSCYFHLSGPILCLVLGSITPLHSKFQNMTDMIDWSVHLSYYFFVSPYSSDTIRSFYNQISIYSLSLFFMILTTFLVPICILVGWSGMRSYGKEYIIASLIREFLMITVFRMLDPLLFYVLPESVSIPMLCGAEHLIFAGIKLFLCRGLVQDNRPGLIVKQKSRPAITGRLGVWGSRQRKIKAAYQFFLYTSLGSVFMLLAILLILLQIGTIDLQISLTTSFSERRQIFLWIASFTSFSVKVPMVLVHIWSPEAHVEAPTAGSIIFAGTPSKLGTHEFLRFSIPMFPEATLCSTPFIYTPSTIAIIYTPSTTSRQIDLKKIIAHSPVAHMNLVTIGMSSRAAAIRSPILSVGPTKTCVLGVRPINLLVMGEKT